MGEIKSKSVVMLTLALLFMVGSASNASTCNESALKLKELEHQAGTDFLSHKGPESLRTNAVNILSALEAVQRDCLSDASAECLKDISDVRASGNKLIETIESGVKNPAVAGGQAKSLLNSLRSANKDCGIEKIVGDVKKASKEGRP